MKYLFFLIVILGLGIQSYAQPRFNAPDEVESDSGQGGNFMDRVTFGGDFGLSFGNITYILVAPRVGYKITDDLIGGVSLSYAYLRQRPTNFQAEFETSRYGGGLFGMFFVNNDFFISAEYEAINFEYLDFTTVVEEKRSWFNALFLGGGYNVPLGGRAFLQFRAAYNLLHREYPYPYASPFDIRGGIMIM